MKKLHDLWDRIANGGRFKMIGYGTSTIRWSDTGATDTATVYFFENAAGRRRIDSSHTSSLYQAKNTTFMHAYAVPWLHGLVDCLNIPSFEMPDPYIYESLGYRLEGSVECTPSHNDKIVEISYFFYQNDKGLRRVTCQDKNDQGLIIPAIRDEALEWIHGKRSLPRISGFVPARIARATPAITQRPAGGNAVVVPFKKPE